MGENIIADKRIPGLQMSLSRTAVFSLLFPSIVLGQTGGRRQPALGIRSAPIIQVGGRKFKDLNRDGRLEPYEDWRLSPSTRAKDLVARMALEEKAGMMMHGTARSGGPMGAAGAGSEYDTVATGRLIRDASVTSFITRLRGAPAILATQNNALQEIAERTRLGIPLTISTDPRAPAAIAVTARPAVCFGRGTGSP